MNVVVDSKPNCLATLHVELEPERVEKEWQAVAKQFQKQARIPGFRPGKAPQAIVEKKYSADIREELTNKLLRKAMNEAIEQKKLRVISVSKVDDVQIGEDKTMRFTATLVTSPEFELPNYKGVEVELAMRTVGDEDIESALKSIAEQHASFETIEGRALKMDDFAILSYSAMVDGKPVLEEIADCPPLIAGKPNWWVRMAPGTLVPGFCEALDGMNVDETRNFEIEVDGEFPFEPLRGRKLAYTATLHEIRERRMPEFDDALASKIDPGKTLAEVRDRVRMELTKYAENDYESGKRSGALQKVLSQVTCELPAHLVNNEMTGILREIVQENQGRGISEEELKSHQDEILGAAKQSATERVRSTFVLLRIAEQEKLDATEQDLAFHVTQLASRYQIPVQKMIKDLQRRNAFGSIREQILAGKALDFIASNATVREPAGSAAPAASEA